MCLLPPLPTGNDSAKMVRASQWYQDSSPAHQTAFAGRDACDNL